LGGHRKTHNIMKNLLTIIAFALGSFMLSAAEIPDKGNAALQGPFIPEVHKMFNIVTPVLDLSFTAEANQELSLQSEVSKRETSHVYFASAALIDLVLFYRPVVYESHIASTAAINKSSGTGVKIKHKSAVKNWRLFKVKLGYSENLGPE
jgi:hypothetical protein